MPLPAVWDGQAERLSVQGNEWVDEKGEPHHVSKLWSLGCAMGHWNSQEALGF